ncbi:hypothetical protein BS329_38110 [Amycolatopsis coloradensis]|uniref:Uncharacterized protein n=1 Tax=Amycolatopsis coloradensis TaxID=76021 RepID=A0A1R0KFA0_9PSEU|nr:hypothetical protein [Amycolatopsis coloradensis]OLZ43866.1 hypothetical protein BS329_38110 [Amycolatopsis coloradensis]
MQDHFHPVPRPPVPGPPPVQVDQFSPQDTDPRAGVDEAVAGLDDLASLPLSEHVERFEAVHTELTVALSTIDKV